MTETIQTEKTYTVTGMSCEHCVRAVTEELGKIDGVSGVTVDLLAGSVTVRSAVPVDATAVRAAVQEAGYDLGD